MKTIILLLGLLCISLLARAQKSPVDTLYKAGPLEKRINVVILGDGFTSAEMPAFTAEARKFVNFFLGFEPYNRYRDYFNFFSIRTPSAQSGITNPGTAADAYPDQPVEQKDTYYGVSFGPNIQRLLTITNREAYSNVLAKHFPSFDMVIMLANTPYYGAAGGGVAIFSLKPETGRVGVHEVGHTLADLADEYWEGEYNLYAREGPNITADSLTTTVKWKNWLNHPPIGIYRHGNHGASAQWFKPAQGTCLMEFLTEEYCAVCREAIVEKILQLVDPVERFAPDTLQAVHLQDQKTFSIDLLNPKPNSLQVEWRLNGQLISTDPGPLSLQPDAVTDYSRLTVTVFDSTALSRRANAREAREKSITWTLRSPRPAQFQLIASASQICEGEMVKFESVGCPGTVTWSTGASGHAVSSKPSQTTTIAATCKTTGQTAQAPVVVFPGPDAMASNTGPYVVGATVKLAASGGVRYAWNGPRDFRADTPQASIPDARLQSAGIYTVTVTDAHGCSKAAQTEVKIEPVLAVTPGAEAWLNVYPNPAKGQVTVRTALAGVSVFSLFDQAGRLVLSRTFESEAAIALELPAGMYVYRFENGVRTIAGKLAVE